MERKGRRGHGKSRNRPAKAAKGLDFVAAIETVKKDFAQVSSKLRKNDTKAIAKADQILQHIKGLYDDPKLPSEYEVEVCDLYEKIKNDMEALDFMKKLGTTIKTRAQTDHANDVAHQTWVKVVENHQTRERTQLEPLLSALERGGRVGRKTRSKKKRTISDIKQNERSSKKTKTTKVSKSKKKKNFACRINSASIITKIGKENSWTFVTNKTSSSNLDPECKRCMELR